MMYLFYLVCPCVRVVGYLPVTRLQAETLLQRAGQEILWAGDNAPVLPLLFVKRPNVFAPEGYSFG